jgi:lycopene beta-cyclase
VIIVGGGLAGALAALALAQGRPDVPLLLLEQGKTFGGNHIWSFFDTDLDMEQRRLVEPLISHSWPDHEICFPKRCRRLAIGYNSIRSERLHAALVQTLRPDQIRLGCSIDVLAADHVIAGGERLPASSVIDARGPMPMPGLELGWQKFVGRTYAFADGHNVPRPIIMDATVQQQDGYRFLYSLPFSGKKLMLEDTYYSDTPDLDVAELGRRLDVRAGAGARPIAQEEGVLPVLVAGELASIWPLEGPPIARLGLRGGFFHPTTGYSLPDAVSNALLLAEQSDFGANALQTVFRHRAETLWNKRRFYQLLNRMLFRAAEPAERYRVLEHFYRLDENLIGRFYAGRLTGLDKMKILTGRPPVPVHRALGAMRARAA